MVVQELEQIEYKQGKLEKEMKRIAHEEPDKFSLQAIASTKQQIDYLKML